MERLVERGLVRHIWGSFPETAGNAGPAGMPAVPGGRRRSSWM